MVIGSILGLKLKDVHREIIFLFFCSLLELSVAVLYAWQTLMEAGYLLGQQILIGLFLLVGLGAYFFYKNTILGGIYCFRIKKWKKHLEPWMTFEVVHAELKRENHYPTRGVGHRYYRYYFLIEWEDHTGKRYKGRSTYFHQWMEDKLYVKRLQVQVNPKDNRQYICEI